MKLIIDVDEKLVCEGFERIFTEEERNILIRAIGNGTPYEERPQGKWLITWERYIFQCSYCHGVSGKYNYCPNCGADMKEADNGS